MKFVLAGANIFDMSTSLANPLGLCASFAASVAADEQDRIKVTSLRRTFSADMSSITGLKKKIVPDVVGMLDEADGRLMEKDDINRPRQIDVWTSILSQKNDSHSAVLPPYVHPLVKRSASLSKKSLEICTESLGSETGSDVFSPFPTSEISSREIVKIETDQSEPLRVEAAEEVQVVKYNCAYHNKKSSGLRSFPPPLPSLARSDGASLHMHSHREKGRLVLAAVSIPTQNNFHAKRKDGRLLLTFVNENKSDSTEADEKNDDEQINKDGVVSDEPKDGEMEEGLDTKKNMAAIGVIHVQNPTFIVNKVITLTSRHTSIWTNKFNEVMKVELQSNEASDHHPRRLTTGLISSTPSSMTSALRPLTGSTFNAYEYCWRRKSTPATTTVFKTSSGDTPPSSSASISKNHNMFILTKPGKDSKNKNEDKMPTNFLVLKGNGGEGDFIVPYFNGCKNLKRPLLYREPYCIASS